MSVPEFDPAAALVSYHAAVDAHDLVAIESWLAPAAAYHSAGLGTVTGRVAIIAAMRDYFAKCPDHQSWDDEIQSTGPRTAQSRWQLTATNKVTGERIHRHGIEVVEFDALGKIINVHVEDHEEGKRS